MLAVLYTLILVRFGKRLRTGLSATDHLALMAGIVITVTVGILFVSCFTVGSPFWGRHLASLLPFVVLTCAIAASRVSDKPHWQLDMLASLLCVTLLASSLLVRFHPDHRRDDYRGASSVARIAVQEGRTVWWAASPECAEYYGLAFCNPGIAENRACVIATENRKKEELAGLPQPDLIVISKPELYDRTKAVQAYAGDHRFQVKHRMKAFEVFESP
jgi:hypothetical protein